MPMRAAPPVGLRPSALRGTVPGAAGAHALPVAPQIPQHPGPPSVGGHSFHSMPTFQAEADTRAMATALAEQAKADNKQLKGLETVAGQLEAMASLPMEFHMKGLVDTLKGAGPFTVFAPTDEAFAKLPAGTVEDLLKPENKDKLVAILTYHVVPGKVMSTDLSEGLKAATVNGAEITITLEGGPKVIGAVISGPDVAASIGVIHVIDSVILPPM